MTMFLSTVNITATILFLFVYTILSFIFILENKGRHNSHICKWILFILIFQNLILGIGAHFFGNTDKSSLQIVSQFPFVFIAINWIYILSRRQHFNKEHIIFLLLIFFIILSAFIGRGDINAILINIRNMICFFMLFDISNYYLTNIEDRDNFYRYCMKISKVLLLFGIVLLLSGYDLYEIIGIKEVYIAKGSPLVGNTLDGRFYTTLLHNEVIRMGSILYEPVNLAYIYAGFLLISIFFTKKKASNILTCSIGLILTFGKGGYIIVSFIMVYFFTFLLLKKILYRFHGTTIMIISMITVIFFAVTFSILYYKNIGAASSPHFWAVERTCKNVMKKPIGYGLGLGGNMSNLFNSGTFSFDIKSEWLSSGGESALMSFLYQIGIQGVAVFIWCILSLRNNIRDCFSTRNIVNYIIPIIIILISILQDNTYTPQCIVVFMFILGIEKNNSGFKKYGNLKLNDFS